MQRKNSCRRPSALAALLLLSLLCAVLVTGCTAPEKSPETVKPGSHISLPTENPADAIRTLAGTVVDATIHLLTVDAPDDNLYTFDKSQTLVETGEKGLLVGSRWKFAMLAIWTRICPFSRWRSSPLRWRTHAAGHPGHGTAADH